MRSKGLQTRYEVSRFGPNCRVLLAAGGWGGGAPPAEEQGDAEFLRGRRLQGPRSPASPATPSLGTREAPTYLSARSLSPRSASAIPSKLRASSRPMARKPRRLALPGPGALWAAPAVRLLRAGRAPPRGRRAGFLHTGRGGSALGAALGLCHRKPAT